MKIQPEFDGKVWFYGDVEARTIRGLLEKLPAGTKVKDYYPRGYAEPVVVRTPRLDTVPPPLPAEVRYVSTHGDVIRTVEVKKPVPPAPRTRGEWTPELTAWVLAEKKKGRSAGSIGIEIGFSRNAVTGKLDRLAKRAAKEKSDEAQRRGTD